MAIAVLVLTVASVLSSGLSMLALLTSGPGALLGVLGLAVLLPIYAWLLRYVLRALRPGPAIVTLDEHGITDTRQSVSFVPWDDVERVRLGAGDKSHYLCIEFKSAEIAKRYTRAPTWWTVWWRLAESMGDWNVSLLTLRCRRAEVLKYAESCRRAAIRRRVVQLNQP
jgi:hypothetical protein